MTSRMSVPSMVMLPDGDVVEAGHQADDGRLAAARAAEQRHELSRLDIEADVVEHGGERVVAEGHVLERNGALDLVQATAFGRSLHVQIRYRGSRKCAARPRWCGRSSPKAGRGG